MVTYTVELWHQAASNQALHYLEHVGLRTEQRAQRILHRENERIERLGSRTIEWRIWRDDGATQVAHMEWKR